jgi:hypothetical protein
VKGLGSAWPAARYAAVVLTVVLGVGAMPAAASAAGPAQHQPPASPTVSELWGVSCTSASACTAVGDRVSNTTGANIALVERWNGTAWTTQSTPVPAGAAASYFNAVSCTSASACTAVGQKTGDTGLGTLAEAWNGTAWTVQSTPNPSGASGSSLYAVSCTSASACTAVGYYVIGGVYEPLAEVWNGTAWTIQSVPAPTGAVVTGLAAVSCTSASACIATGDYVTGSLGSTNYAALVEVWNGTAWSIQSVPTPSDATTSALDGVSCTSASACTATGWYGTSAGVRETLAERWNGTTWTVQSTPNPSDATSSILDGVSCASSSACTSTGWYQTAAGVIETLAEVWNGTTWAIQPTPNRTGATSSYLFSVSCAAASVCKAAGYDLSPSYTALAEGINGTAWVIQSTPTG